MSTYNIGQVSRMFGLPVSTLRYYDKEGLFPRLQRANGARKFSDTELETLRMIECLKQSGLGISDIRRYMEWYEAGVATFPLRKQLLQRQKAEVEREIAALQKALAMISYKCWLYEASEPRLSENDEDALHAELRQHMPPRIQALYDAAHCDDDR